MSRNETNLTRATQHGRYPNSVVAKYGLVGGFIAVLIMTILILAMDVMMGFPADAFFTMIGLAMSIPMAQAALMGGAIHIFMGTIFGATTGVVANSTPYFRNKFIGRGTSRATILGLLSGTTLFAILFTPLLTLLMPPAMMTLLSNMNPSASQTQIASLAAGLLPLFLTGGLVLHWIYGGILGAVRGRLIR
jgi:hypothetical protein